MRPLDDYMASGEEWFAALFDKASEREFRILGVDNVLDILIEG